MKNIENIKEALNDKEIIGLVIPDLGYDEMLHEVAGLLSRDYKILYISIDKACKSIAGKIEKVEPGIDTNKFYFIDCISRTSKYVPSEGNCTYVSSPRALDEVQQAVIDVLRGKEVNMAIIDSPSSLLKYYEHVDVLKFMHLFMIKLLTAGCKGIFPFQRESEGPLKRSVEMFVDEIVYLDEFEV